MKAIELPHITADSDHPFLVGRGLKAESLNAYGAGFTDDGKELYMPSYVDGFPVFAKIRGKGKKFWSVGELPHDFGLYGWHSPSTKKHVLIVEGEADAWAAFQMMEGRMSVLSVPLGAKDAHDRVRADLHLLEQYERIYVMLDNDKEGQAATARVLEVLNPALAYPVVGREGYKDASDYLKEGATDLFRTVVYAAQHVIPAGFVSPEERAKRALAFYQDENSRQGISFGYPALDAMMGGQRPGEVISWIGGTGSAKSTTMRSLLHKLYTTKTKTLYVPLEDLPEAVDIMLAQAVLEHDYIHDGNGDPQALVDTIIDIGQYVEVLQGTDITSGQDVLHKFEYGVRQRGARVIILDHLTWLAESSGDATKTLQEFMPKVKQLAIRLGVTIHLVSHLNRDKADKTDTSPTLARLKHSAAVAQASDAVVGLSGDRDKNELKLAMLKQSRLWGRTEVTEGTFTVNDYGMIVETSWEDRLGDLDDDETEDEAPSQGETQPEPEATGGAVDGPVEPRKRRASREPKPDAVLREGDAEVSGDSDPQEDSRLRPAERTVSGTEGTHEEQPGDDGLVVPPPLADGDHWSTTSSTLPGR